MLDDYPDYRAKTAPEYPEIVPLVQRLQAAINARIAASTITDHYVLRLRAALAEYAKAAEAWEGAQ